jgi:hypothetical protein
LESASFPVAGLYALVGAILVLAGTVVWGVLRICRGLTEMAGQQNTLNTTLGSPEWRRLVEAKAQDEYVDEG